MNISPMNNSQALITIAVIAIFTYIIRSLPFWLFANSDKKPPKTIRYLGVVLPYSAVMLLIIYFLKDTEISLSSVVPIVGAIAILCAIHIWKRNQLLSVTIGTSAYIILLQIFGSGISAVG